MRNLHRLLAIVISLTLLVSLAGIAAGSTPMRDAPSGAPKKDNLSSPLSDQQNADRQSALERKLAGKANDKGNALQAANGQYVDFPVDREDRIFVILAEFGEEIDPAYGGDAGPLHNEILEPDRAVDNTTIWQADYNPAHYEDMYFNQMLDYYQAQSSGRYSFNGDVTEWVKVTYNEARYGSNDFGDSIVWDLLAEAIDIWTADQIADGMTAAEVKAYLDTFDVWDRYDHDGDTDFDEPDGYIDHFQIVHAGQGEEVGGGAQGTDAIWSHRWYAFYGDIGSTGPPGALFGGTEFGDTDIWVGDYTIQPENGGLGVFAHEYAHDLGLPDAYDTAGGENSTGFWTIMSSGSYLGDGTVDLGSRPGDFSFWEKFQLGWAKYAVGFAGARSTHRLGPAEFTTKQAQGLFVVLPRKLVETNLGAPAVGSAFYYSGSGDNLDNSMTRSVTLPAGPAVGLTAQVRYEIEIDWDYAYLTVNGASVATNLSTNSDPNGQNFGEGITGSSSGNWVALTADLSAYAGQTVDIGFRYWTDVAVVESGFEVDDIQIDGAPLGDNETAAGWTFEGFKVSTGVESALFSHYYVAEYRTYRGYDSGLQTGPYNFGFLNTLPDWVEHFPYQDGLLISYWDTSQSNNNTSLHPGQGLILPIDAHPYALIRPVTNTPWRSRVQAYDSTFGLWKTDAITLHVNGVPRTHPSLPAVSVFNDSTDFWDPSTPLANVITPNTGTTIRVVNLSPTGFLQVQVN